MEGERTLFESGDLRARLVPGDGEAGGPLFVTFSSYHKQPTLDRPGFGEDFFSYRRIDTVHVVARTNRWFQHAELPAMLSAIRAVAGGYDRVISYGSSMGGFAALTYGAECGATIGLALSPQVSLSRRDAPFETRWRSEARRIARWRPGLGRLALQVIAYDPWHALDRAHYDALSARAPTIGIRVGHGGHPAGARLSDADLLKPLVDEIVAGTVAAGRYEARLRAARAESPQYLFTVSRRLAPHHHAAKIWLAERALARHPSPHNRCNLATMLDAAGRHDEADRLFAIALAEIPGDVDAIAAYADMLIARGDHEAAQATLRRGLAILPDRGLRRRLWRARLARLGIPPSLL